eukprot:scaffold36_cov397-Prasinococcus_capsulatus_cf.AAC.7
MCAEEGTNGVLFEWICGKVHQTPTEGGRLSPFREDLGTSNGVGYKNAITGAKGIQSCIVVNNGPRGSRRPFNQILESLLGLAASGAPRTTVVRTLGGLGS